MCLQAERVSQERTTRRAQQPEGLAGLNSSSAIDMYCDPSKWSSPFYYLSTGGWDSSSSQGH